MRKQSNKMLHNSPSKADLTDTEVEVIGKELKNQIVKMFGELKEETHKQFQKMCSELGEDFI